MNYHEEYMWSLTSPTTCYTGTRHTPSSLCFATAQHTVSLDPSSNTISSKDLPVEDHTICVGYSCTGEWEAIALLDTTQLQQSQQQQQQSSQVLRRESGTTSLMQQSMGTLPDDASTTVVTHDTTTSASLHRRGATISSDASHLAESNSRLSSIDSIDSTTGLSGSDLPKAQLILRSSTQEYAVCLDFRPLAPTICETTNTPGIWLGSADTSKLYWYIPEPHTAALMSVPLDHAAFAFESSVMAIDVISQNDDKSHVLAVACQDGTIRLMSFEYNNAESSNCFQNVRETTVIVDGPIVCVHLRKEEDRIVATAGSLCGYVTELYQQEGRDWEGPFMVAEGFWNKRLQAEDSVLAVRALGDRVSIGTQSGRCLVYAKQENGYALGWECQLPYSIHSFCAIPSDPSNLSKLIVTTRRSIHVFAPTTTSKKRYDANLARERLQALLKKQKAVANQLVEP